MNHLIVISHPRQESFNHAVLQTLVDASEAAGDSVKVRDLYQENFEPVLSLSDLANVKKGTLSSDILREQEYIQWADWISFVFPLWWNGFPAMLKGYVDRVFTNGFAFRSDEEGIRGLLSGKKAMIVTTSGMDEEDLEQYGLKKSLFITQDWGVFKFAGMEIMEHQYLGGVTRISDEKRQEMLKQLRKTFFQNHPEISVEKTVE